MTVKFGNNFPEPPRPGDERGADDWRRKVVLWAREQEWLNGGKGFIVDQDGDQIFNDDGVPLVG